LLTSISFPLGGGDDVAGPLGTPSGRSEGFSVRAYDGKQEEATGRAPCERIRQPQQPRSPPRPPDMFRTKLISAILVFFAPGPFPSEMRPRFSKVHSPWPDEAQPFGRARPISGLPRNAIVISAGLLNRSPLCHAAKAPHPIRRFSQERPSRFPSNRPTDRPSTPSSPACGPCSAEARSGFSIVCPAGLCRSRAGRSPPRATNRCPCATACPSERFGGPETMRGSGALRLAGRRPEPSAPAERTVSIEAVSADFFFDRPFDERSRRDPRSRPPSGSCPATATPPVEGSRAGGARELYRGSGPPPAVLFVLKLLPGAPGPDEHQLLFRPLAVWVERRSALNDRRRLAPRRSISPEAPPANPSASKPPSSRTPEPRPPVVGIPSSSFSGKVVVGGPADTRPCAGQHYIPARESAVARPRPASPHRLGNASPGPPRAGGARARSWAEAVPTT